MASQLSGFVPNWQGIRNLFNGSSVQKACLSGAEQVAQHARHGIYSYQTDVRPGRNVAHARCTWHPGRAERELGGDYYRYKKKDPAIKALKGAAREYGGKING